ncbi:hypothetical protein MMALV_11250 [Candidatus Methanomethylophilus alvi Mx1201]|uniref:Uncharacterized protein n=1 Tax=Methanomethylophilus alvi (strain Mx1201) TaxID=1236689 RepID=M9SID4_METAX|nr:hypothetical protein MMALV_11250 [Candidatus Methanomethylophilus alvi Mx1201]
MTLRYGGRHGLSGLQVYRLTAETASSYIQCNSVFGHCSLSLSMV